MTAKEMFEKLGFNKYIDSDFYLSYKRATDGYDISINKINGEIIITSDIGYDRYFISNQLHVAITQQMKELGWIE